MRELWRSLVDFFQYAFLLALTSFIIVYIVAGNRLYIFAGLLKILVPVAYFGTAFLLGVKFNREREEKLRKEDHLADIIIYFVRADKIKDLIVVFLVPVVIMSIAFFGGYFQKTDFLQALFMFILMFFWNLIIFRKKDNTPGMMYMTNLSRINDQIVIFLLPFLIIIIAAVSGQVSGIDILQALAAFSIFYLWRKLLLLSAKKL